MSGKPTGFHRWVNEDSTNGIRRKIIETRLIFLKSGFDIFNVGIFGCLPLQD
jgi:hypothetical protein